MIVNRRIIIVKYFTDDENGCVHFSDNYFGAFQFLMNSHALNISEPKNETCFLVNLSLISNFDLVL